MSSSADRNTLIGGNLTNDERERNREALRKLWIVTYNLPIKKKGRSVVCKHCGKGIVEYFRGSSIVWKHENRLVYCNTQPMYVTKAEPRVD
jgi:hypothetical protein